MSLLIDSGSLENLWRQLAKRLGTENQELDLSLRLPVVIGCTSECRPYIMLLCNTRPKALNSLKAIDVRVTARQSPIKENWSLTFILKDWSLLHAFAEICLAFIERIRRSSSERSALREIYATMDQWRRLLKNRRRNWYK